MESVLYSMYAQVVIDVSGDDTMTFACELKVARYSFSGSISPKFEQKLRRHNKDLEKLPPQLY